MVFNANNGDLRLILRALISYSKSPEIKQEPMIEHMEVARMKETLKTLLKEKRKRRMY